MSNKKEYIERVALLKAFGCENAVKYGNKSAKQQHNSYSSMMLYEIADEINDVPAADVEPVVRCQKCKHGTPFDRNSEMDESMYLHCAIGRGEDVRNVWHKYKKYYKDYSVVDRGGFCDQGEAGEPDMERSGSGE